MCTPVNRRVRLRDFADRPISLPDGPEAWEPWPRPTPGDGKDAEDILLLGLGPGRPESLSFTKDKNVFWLEEPRILRLLNVARPPGDIPDHWRQVSIRRALELVPQCRVHIYRLNGRLAPLFWGPVMGSIAAGRVNPGQAGAMHATRRNAEKEGRGMVLLPGTAARLLHQELASAFRNAGFTVAEMPLWNERPRPFAVWETAVASRPALVLSVNLRGLDPDGEIFWLCRALRVPVAIWCVDNPWHLLSALPLPWWKEATLFVTDASFIPALREAGAGKAHYLPLAVAPHMWRGLAREQPLQPVFAGHSAFPDRERFFAAAHPPEETLEHAAQGALPGCPDSPAAGPHFHWWMDKLKLCPWPGQAARRAGFGADTCSRLRRARWIAAALAAGLRLIGDDGWRALLPGIPVLPPVDYYTALPDCYARSAVLNVTSLLLPHSLSQRHFDVWAAGGLLLTDATPGLEIFPAELTRPVVLEKPEDFAPRLALLRANSVAVFRLREQWREALREGHCYEHRVARICGTLGL
ncbi:MAG: DUF3880 domain-containing protein [Desulfovibrio sp.]|jgi:hypothetical protein|nr:DUF3880 domain-containing protein [Desulfovibrio sp.]